MVSRAMVSRAMALQCWYEHCVGALCWRAPCPAEDGAAALIGPQRHRRPARPARLVGRLHQQHLVSMPIVSIVRYPIQPPHTYRTSPSSASSSASAAEPGPACLRICWSKRHAGRHAEWPRVGPSPVRFGRPPHSARWSSSWHELWVDSCAATRRRALRQTRAMRATSRCRAPRPLRRCPPRAGRTPSLRSRRRRSPRRPTSAPPSRCRHSPR